MKTQSPEIPNPFSFERVKEIINKTTKALYGVPYTKEPDQDADAEFSQALAEEQTWEPEENQLTKGEDKAFNGNL